MYHDSYLRTVAYADAIARQSAGDRHAPRSLGRMRMRAGGGRLGAALVVLALGVLGAPGVVSATVTESVVAGAQQAPDTGFLTSVSACTRHVAASAGASDANPGTSAQPWRTVRHAMDVLGPGETACVHSGTYVEGPLTAAHTGSPTAPIAVRGAPGEPRPTVRAAGDGNLFSFGPGIGNWLVAGFDIDKNHTNGASVQDLGANHIAIQDNVIRDGKSGAAVLLRNGATDVLIQGNDIFGHHRWVNPTTGDIAYTRLTTSYFRADANGINEEGSGVARVRIAGNRLHDNGGDGNQCIGVDDSVGPSPSDPADIDIVDDRAWSNSENAYDIKSCQRVSIRGSVSPETPGAGTANNKIFGYRPTVSSADLGGNHSDGTAIVVHFFARNVRIENTRIWDSCRGISLGRDTASDAVRNIVVKRTLLFGMADAASCGGKTPVGLSLIHVAGFDGFDNTFAGIPGTAVIVASENGAGTKSSDIDLFNNIIETTGAHDWINLFRGGLSSPTEFESDRNLFWNADGSTTHYVILPDRITKAAWQAAGFDATSRWGDPLFVPDPQTNDYFTQAGSPARDVALPATGMTPCGAGPDIGFKESGC